MNNYNNSIASILAFRSWWTYLIVIFISEWPNIPWITLIGTFFEASLVPAGEGLYNGVEFTYDVLAIGTEYGVTYVVVPVGKGVGWTVETIGEGISWSADTIFIPVGHSIDKSIQTTVKPIGKAVDATIDATSNVVKVITRRK